ncbi:hypothetical protein F4677DRAFT_463696 [Hypoxylon crocopeplum]|nr:hypothetical protein F4677DRAFT_463696 [Hypoxylon crocopeplum]
MADPISIVGTTIAVVQLSDRCIQLLRSQIGPSKRSTGEIESLQSKLNGFDRAMKQFQRYVEARRSADDQDEGPLNDLDYLKPAVKDCETALHTIEDFVGKSSLKQNILGAKFDKKLGRALSSLSEARQLFTDVVVLNNNASSLRIEQHMRNLSAEVQKIQQFPENSETLNSELRYQYRDRVRKWLAPHQESNVNQYEQLDRHLRARAPGSCSWLLQHDLYHQWLYDDEAPPLLWVEGQPGLGKSVLCSTAVEHAISLDKCATFYYCRFDSQCTAVQAAGYLVEQLFEYLWRKDEQIVHAAMDISKKTSYPTTDGLLAMVRYLIHELQRIEVLESGDTPKFLMFLDGLDEEPQEEEALKPFVFKLLEEFPTVLKIWVSSRPSQRIQRLLKQYPTIQVREHTGYDVRVYLEGILDEVSEGGPNEYDIARESILPKLLQRCQGNFLFARFLADFIREGSFRPDDLPQKIQDELPTDLRDIYRRILQQYKDRKLASELLSIVAFARRPLRLRELEEAMAMVVSNDTGENLNHRNKPWNIDNIFYPLIEKIPNRDEPANPFCHITHSSVKDYLIQNPSALQQADGRQHRIGEHLIAEACLRYLMQKCYSEPFRSTWAINEAIGGHHLLTYAAKYWDKHLDAVESTPRRSELTYGFLCSRNFQTLLQVQSIAIESHFGFFSRKRDNQIHFRKVFPQSLDGKGGRIVRDYLHFVGEWKYLLDCHCGDEDGCPVYEHRGNIIRCLSGLMGPDSFLKNMKEKHPSFMLHEGDYDIKHFQPGVADGFSVDGSETAIVISRPAGAEGFHLTINFWNQRYPNSPMHSTTSQLTINEKRSNWFLYAGNSSNARKSLSRPGPISFSEDFSLLRIGSQLFLRDEESSFKEIPNFQNPRIDLTRYFEEFTSRDGIVVLSRRQNRQEPDVQPGISDSDLGFIMNIMHGWHNESPSTITRKDAEPTRERSCSSLGSSIGSPDSELEDDYSSREDDISSSEERLSESDVGNSAEESYSEGSTEHASDLDTSQDEYDGLSEAGSSDSDNYSDDSRAEIILSHEQLLGDLTGYVKDSSDDEDEERGRYAGTQRYRPSMPTSRTTKSKNECDRLGSIAVLDLRGAEPRQIFHFDYELPVMLYHSPPVIHPSKPLVVWPLCGGDILFVDYLQKTYFIRRVLATTRFTRHVCMKVHFSHCGRYMHIATIEAQNKRKAKMKSKKEESLKELSIAVFVTTHRLSERKTTRSPPTLVHRVKASLGDFVGFTVSKLPFTFTWTKDHVYVTQSSYRLSVVRIDLFKKDLRASPSSPMIPREIVLLPASAQQREVRYFPPTSTDKRGVVLIGSHRSNRSPTVEIMPAHISHVDIDVRASPYRYPSPPVGLYVDEEKDLGGWVPAGTGQRITNRYRDGVLIRKIEPFDAEDDCELEDFVSPEDLK